MCWLHNWYHCCVNWFVTDCLILSTNRFDMVYDTSESSILGEAGTIHWQFIVFTVHQDTCFVALITISQFRLFIQDSIRQYNIIDECDQSSIIGNGWIILFSTYCWDNWSHSISITWLVYWPIDGLWLLFNVVVEYA